MTVEDNSHINSVFQNPEFAIATQQHAVEILGMFALRYSEVLERQINPEDYMKFNINVTQEPISSLLTKESDGILFDYPAEKVWTGKISLASRLETEPTLAKKVEAALTPDNLHKYIVVANKQAPARCIDGRIRKGWAGLTETAKHFLGPKNAGGTPHAALAHRIVDADSLKEDLLFEHDIEYVIGRFSELGIGIGGHIDGHAKGWNTGCGAIDNINKILEKMQLPETQEQLRGLTKTILGDGYDGRNVVNEVIGRMLYLDALKPLYMPKEGNRPDGEFLYKRLVMDLLRKNADEAHEAVPELEGSHNEVAIVLNFTPGTTFDNDQFAFDNDHEVQAFGWDVWEMFEEAERLYPYSMQESPDLQRISIEKRMKYVTTRTLLGISTAMVLTDGSLRLALVQPAA